MFRQSNHALPNVYMSLQLMPIINFNFFTDIIRILEQESKKVIYNGLG